MAARLTAGIRRIQTAAYTIAAQLRGELEKGGVPAGEGRGVKAEAAQPVLAAKLAAEQAPNDW